MKQKKYENLKRLNLAQKKAYRKHNIIPKDWWNYGINPLLGYRNTQLIKKRIVENSHPVPKFIREA